MSLVHIKKIVFNHLGKSGKEGGEAKNCISTERRTET